MAVRAVIGAPKTISVVIQPFAEARGTLHSVLFTPQTLTESQQKQARENLGIMPLKTDGTLTLSEGNVLSVNTAKDAEKDNTLPITAAAVYETVGNIEILLETI